MNTDGIFEALQSGIRFEKKELEKQEVFQREEEHVKIDMRPSSTLDYFNCGKVSDPLQSVYARTQAKYGKKGSTGESKEAHEEEAVHLAPKVVRKRHRIFVNEASVAAPAEHWEHLFERYSIKKYLQRALLGLGYQQPTPIQMQGMPILLEHRDMIAVAPTGSGKTVGFLVPLLAKLKVPKKDGVRGLVISPTRELATQIYEDLRTLSEGKKFKIKQLRRIVKGKSKAKIDKETLDILIVTPQRLATVIRDQELDLSNVSYLVMDEADRLLDLGLLDQVDTILGACSNPDLQKTLWSATMHPHIMSLANGFMRDPVLVSIGNKDAAATTINQKLVYAGDEAGKVAALQQIFREGVQPPILVFVQSKERADELYKEFVYERLRMDVIHADKTQKQRDETVANFRLGKIWILITTELLARGLDFVGVRTVINYDFPQSATSYIHRIGRTGRAGKSGNAITLFTDEDVVLLRLIVNVMRSSGCEVPDWMLALKKPRKGLKKAIAVHAPKRKSVWDAGGNVRKRFKMPKTAKKKDEELDEEWDEEWSADE